MANTKVNEPELLNQKLMQPQKRSLMWLGYAVFIWSLIYVIPHLYWALGGTIGISMFKASISELSYWKMANLIASIFLAAVAFLGFALIYLKRPLVIRRLLFAITLVGCLLSTSHGVFGIIYRIFQVAGVVEVDSDPFNSSKHAYVLWDLFLIEPWITIEGILLGIVGLFCLNDLKKKKVWLILYVVGIMVGLITAVLGSRFA